MSAPVLFILLLLLSSCQQGDEFVSIESASLSPVVATVNGLPVRESDIDAEIANLPEKMYQYRDDPDVRGHILRRLIRQRATSQKARQLGLHLDPAIQKRIDRMQDQILIEAAKEWRLVNMANIEGAAVEAYYRKHLAEFTVPEQVHARHILLRTEKQAWKVLRAVRQDRGSFAAQAARVSLDDSNKSRGGDLNWFSHGVMVKEFDDVVFDLKKGGLSLPIRTRFGWHVIELLGKRPAVRKPLAEVSDEIISILQHRHLQQWYGEIEKAANVTIKKPEYRKMKARQ